LLLAVACCCLLLLAVAFAKMPGQPEIPLKVRLQLRKRAARLRMLVNGDKPLNKFFDLLCSNEFLNSFLYPDHGRFPTLSESFWRRFLSSLPRFPRNWKIFLNLLEHGQEVPRTLVEQVAKLSKNAISKGNVSTTLVVDVWFSVTDSHGLERPPVEQYTNVDRVRHQSK